MIYNEDCLEGMKRLEDNSVDMIATDPPYCVGVSSNGIKSSFADFNLLRPFWEQCFGEWQHSSREGDTVLDSFMGSGTTAIAAMNLNREFIGFEIDEKYYEVAEKRISEAVAKREQSLFR